MQVSRLFDHLGHIFRVAHGLTVSEEVTRGFFHNSIRFVGFWPAANDTTRRVRCVFVDAFQCQRLGVHGSQMAGNVHDGNGVFQ